MTTPIRPDVKILLDCLDELRIFLAEQVKHEPHLVERTLDQLTKINTAIEQAAAVDEWLPIEDAPETRDGAPILIGEPANSLRGEEGDVEYVPKGVWLSDFLEDRESYKYYQPLPQPPKEAASE